MAELSEDQFFDRGRQWYITFMGADQADTDGEVLDNVSTSWDNLTEDQQLQLATALAKFKATSKARDDADKNVEYAKRYRGAEDDTGEDWRPSFRYYQRRRWNAFAAEQKLADTCRALLQIWEEVGGLAGGREKLEGLLEQFRESVAGTEKGFEKELETLREAAEERVKLLEEGKGREKTRQGMESLTAETITEKGEERKKKKEGKQAGAEQEEDPSGEWYGQRHLGSGGSGTANLWLKVQDGRIRKRVVRKSIDLESIWYSDHHWTLGAPGNEADVASTMPVEIAAHAKTASAAGSSSIVRMLGHQLTYQHDDGQPLADLYLEFCPFGDGRQLVEDSGYNSDLHESRNDIPFERFTGEEIKLVPEPFCWAAMLSMVTTGLIMEREQIAPAEANSWAVIVHRDLKLENVFLGDHPKEHFVGYPQLKIGDFGLAILVPPNDARTEEELCAEGTTDHAAPEMLCKLMTPDGNRAERQSTKTNVWGVGMIMYSLLAGTYGPARQSPWFDFDAEQGNKEPPEFNATTQAGYSQELQDLTLACLRYEARDRPTFDFLLRETRKYTDVGMEDRARGLRDIKQGDAGYMDMYGANPLNHQEDRYQIGLSVDWTDWDEADVPARLAVL